jgi:lipoyl(octanoyl) transferase
MTRRELHGVWLGLRPYAVVDALQQELVLARIRGAAPDTVLLLEHEPVVTLGRRADASHVLLSEQALRARGIALSQTSRGGDVTAHAPGQLVGYPIVDLSPDRCDVRRYVRSLTEVMRSIALAHGISAGEVAGLIGLWVDLDRPTAFSADRDGARLAKLGAIGVRIAHWVTSHGFALNLTTAPDVFRTIVPCGIREHGVTSVREITGTHPETRAEGVRALDALATALGGEVVSFTDRSDGPLEPWIDELRRASGAADAAEAR